MGMEIERKYLVADSWQPSTPALHLRQGYIMATPEKTVRVRTSDHTAWLTIKGKNNKNHEEIARLEFEYTIPLADANTMLETMCQSNIIEKYRYEEKIHGMTWEIDVFLGANKGLIVAEVELEHPHQAITLPDWALENVSSDGRYSNSYLSHIPYSKWN